ncbi:MAG: hypothetical protein HOP33_09085 [Verrucomicrobia bacterium]|nr:hypothetical protein [Verrucomicrobiota bacterium]
MSEITEGTLIGSADSCATTISCHELFEVAAELGRLKRQRRKLYNLKQEIKTRLEWIRQREDLLRHKFVLESRRLTGKDFVPTPWQDCAANPPPS